MVAEVLRSGAFADDVVINLVNRRFVPFFYDLAPPDKNAGDAYFYDEEAVKAIGEIRVRGGGTQDRKGRVRTDYPAAVFLTADGKRLEPILRGVPGPKTFVAELKKFVKDNPDHFKLSESEKGIFARADQELKNAAAQRDAARLSWELAEWEDCLKRIEAGLSAAGKDEHKLRAELFYLHGRSHTCTAEHAKAADALKDALKAAKEAKSDLVDDILAAQARVKLNLASYADALAIYQTILDKHADGNCVGEAMYYAGLCHYYQGDTDKAKEYWRKHRKEMPGDRLARRSATSLGLPEAQAFLNQELVDREGWW